MLSSVLIGAIFGAFVGEFVALVTRERARPGELKRAMHEYAIGGAVIGAMVLPVLAGGFS